MIGNNELEYAVRRLISKATMLHSDITFTSLSICMAAAPTHSVVAYNT